MPVAIEITNLSKKYLLAHESQGSYSTLVDMLSRRAKKMAQKFVNPFKTLPPERSLEEFWALKDINLQIQEGDRVGIIGRNGAGKSTLLKILSRIVWPTTGSVHMRGRIASLLEVGTGFHQELTGRENIYLNGAILGMSRAEIRAKFDEIVSFAEVEAFLDTPVKRFSSGMFMRLGFAIAAHLNPDILVVDEVLAVGDANFQEKCLKKLNQLGQSGRTVIFVSHDIGSVLTLCNRGIYLNQGRVKLSGSMEECVNEYMRECKQHSLSWSGNIGDEHVRFYQVALQGATYDREFFYQNEKIILEIDYEVAESCPDLIIGIGVWNQRNQLLARSHTLDNMERFFQFNEKGRRRIRFHLDTAILHEGDYLIKIDCFIHNKKQVISDEIVLKCPVYQKEKHTRYGQVFAKEGIFLGANWAVENSL